MNTEFNTTIVELLDGDEQHARHPDTFWMPPLAERQALQEGDRVKLVFLCEPTGEPKWTGERMWVRIDDRDPEGNYSGTLLDGPVLLENIDFGDDVFFEARHIIDIDLDDREVA